MHSVVERHAVIHFYVAAHNRAAELEAVAVAVLCGVLIIVAVFESHVVARNFCIEFVDRLAEIAVFKRYAVIEDNRAYVAVRLVCIEVPAVVGVAVCYAAVEYVAVTYGELCGETVGIFALGFVIVVVVRRAVFDEVVAGPLGYQRHAALFTAELQARVAVVVEFAVFDDIIVAGDEHAVIARANNFDAVPIPIIAVNLNAALSAVEGLLAEIEDNVCTVLRPYGYVTVINAAVAQNLRSVELIGARLYYYGIAGGCTLQCRREVCGGAYRRLFARNGLGVAEGYAAGCNGVAVVGAEIGDIRLGGESIRRGRGGTRVVGIIGVVGVGVFCACGGKNHRRR